MVCPRCKKSNYDQAEFCEYCGLEIHPQELKKMGVLRRNLMKHINRKFINYVLTIVGICLVIYVFSGSEHVYKVIKKDAEDYHLVGVKIIECRHLLSSFFYKDEIGIWNNGLTVTTRSLWSNKTNTVAYSEILSFRFYKGLIDYSFTVKGERFQYTIYFKENETKNTIKSFIYAMAPPKIPVIELYFFEFRDPL